jgi:hypothetical protein
VFATLPMLEKHIRTRSFGKKSGGKGGPRLLFDQDKHCRGITVVNSIWLFAS